ncbi:hypothetical protein [Geothrix sp. 21YS21S-2]|uniref:hypothetical protein n=1 Tax=Geothrix sp. 21YS21S-2 TaxID=3068893 RepID=UPI0027B99BD0|nr:hypothetical protein [Geothrix sp. 21YS21S-2]
MHSEIEDWNNGWFGIRLSVSPQEIQELISQLQELLGDHDQHFHISSDYKEASGLGDIQISVKETSEVDNLFLSSLAIPPGSTLK